MSSIGSSFTQRTVAALALLACMGIATAACGDEKAKPPGPGRRPRRTAPLRWKPGGPISRSMGDGRHPRPTQLG